MKLMQLLEQTGIPKGVVNLVHGTNSSVDRLLDHPDVKAISFVGSTAVGKYIYGRASMNGKRVQSNGGAKNHSVIMPDADLEDAANALVGAAFGASGQRCMALSVAIIVGDAKVIMENICDKAKGLTISAGRENPDFGPLISPLQVENIHNWLASSQQRGAKVKILYHYISILIQFIFLKEYIIQMLDSLGRT